MSTPTTVVTTRIPNEYAQSLRRIAALRKTTLSDVVGRILLEQVAPCDGEDLA
jgi:hypothetical protein